jgi:hypothetical protein
MECMSMMNMTLPTPDVGETVATYSKYEGAQRAVSKLIEKDVPARDIAIVGKGLRSVEKITGKLGWGRAAWQGALNGLLLGMLISAFAVIWVPDAGVAMIGGVVLIGLAFGMALRILNYSLVRRRRDYASMMTVTAERYEVAVTGLYTAKSREILGTTKPRTVVSRPPSMDPPRYGVRITDQPRPVAPEEPETGAGPAHPRSTGPAAGSDASAQSRD